MLFAEATRGPNAECLNNRILGIPDRDPAMPNSNRGSRSKVELNKNVMRESGVLCFNRQPPHSNLPRAFRGRSIHFSEFAFSSHRSAITLSHSRNHNPTFVSSSRNQKIGVES